MSGQRHVPPGGDPRFPNDRSPARPAYPSVHPARSSLVGARVDNVSPTDQAPPGAAPRGPKAFAEHRGAGPPPSRGRGLSMRADYRPDFRDRDAFRGRRDLSPPADRPWRDYDRRDARSPPLDHPSHPDFRAPRDAPVRDFDAGRGRRGFRDAPPSARFGDSRPPAAFPPSRDDFSRGRGRPDWAPRGRGRGSYHEERPATYRPRSRSPRGYRPDRDAPLDRYDEPRFERRDSDAAVDREERARDAERYRRDYLANSAGPNRAANVSPGPVSPNGSQHYDAFGPGRAIPSSDRDMPPQRRPSSNFTPLATRESRESFPSRPSSPPHAPEVPAFGSVTFKPSSSVESPWNVWKAPVEQKPSAPSVAPPTAPKAELDKYVPKAPKALRLEGPQQASSDASEAGLVGIPSQHKSASPIFSARPLSGSKAFEPSPTDPSHSQRPPPTGPRQLHGVPVGPKSLSKFETSPPTGPRSVPPPTGPKVPTSPQSANKFANTSVPTGPRASRAPSLQQSRIPTGPSFERSWQRPRIDPPAQQGRGPHGLVPAKRDHEGLAKESKPLPDHAGAHPSEDRGSVTSISEIAAESPSGQRNGGGPAVDYSDDEDAMDLDEGDMAQNEEKFERNKARLEAQKIDLSSRRLRASTPLERLGFLGCLALYDPALFFESRQPKASRPQSDPQPEFATPKGEESEVVEELSLRPSPKLTPSPIATPELKTLPFLIHEPLTPMSDLESLQDNLKRQDTAKGVLQEEIHRRTELLQDEEEHLRRQYEMYYRDWRAEVRILDQAQREREEAERQDAAEPAAEAGAADLSPTVTSATEPRRRAFGFTSEYELQKVLEMSREQAEKEAQARREKEIVNARPDYDREAVVPDLAPELDLRPPVHQDMERLCDPREAVSFWDLMPPQDDFTKEEHDTMLQNFKEYPKKFGKIAQGLRGRSYKDCINHYYATKWNQQYKPPRDKRRARAVRSQRARTGSGLNPRPRANQLISNLDDAKPELYDGEEANAPLAAVTESGRPRRAAAPNFRERETGDQSATTTPGRRGARGDATGNDKSSRKVKGAGRDRQRKTKLQPSARQASMSPEKQMLDGPSDSRAWPSTSETDGVPGMAQLPPDSGPMASTKSELQAPYPVDYQSNNFGFGGPEAGKIQTVRGGHVGPSSYWSVHEVNSFPQLLKHFGTDWPAIANAMGTKSHTMVKNYYGRLKNTENKAEIEALANEGDAKRDRGENPGAPPTPPTFTPRRRNEPPHSTVPRTLAPSTEVVEVEDETPPTTAAGITQSTTPLPSYAAQQQQYSRPLEHQHSRSTSFGQPSTSSQAQQAAPAHAAYPTSPRMQHDRHTSYAIDRAQEIGAPRAMEAPSSAYATQPRDLWERSSRGGEIFQPPVFQRHTSGLGVGGLVRAPSPPRYPERSLFGPASSRPRPPDRRLSDEPERAPMRRADSPQQQSSLRYVMDASNPRPASTSFYDPMRPSSAIASREDPRSMAQVYPPETPKSGPSVAKAEPRKTSNLAAILNADPVEPKPSSTPIPSGSSASRMHTPPQYASQSGYSSAFAPPRPGSQPNRIDYLNDPARPPVQAHQRLAYGGSDALEGNPRDSSLHSSSYRVEWPKSMQPHDRAVDTSSPYEHRSAIRGYDARYNPSPPPPAGGPPDPGRSYDARVSSAHYNPSYRPSTPPGRFNYGPPAHSRDSSLSRPGGGPRESPYLHEHRHSGSGSGIPQHRVGDRAPAPSGPGPMLQSTSSIYSAYSQPGSSRPAEPHPPAQPSGMSSRAKADWTQGIQYREYEERLREGERPPERAEGEWERAREREAEARNDRYGPVGYGPVGGPPGYAARDERR